MKNFRLGQRNKRVMLSVTKLIVFFMGVTSNPLYAASTDKSNHLKKPDVRLLIDISGSMKKNDPNNLRVPALQLITNLLPKGADSGVWAFGMQVNMMVPLSTVDETWQIKATKTANKINSRGLFTNIGAVLDKASYGWSRASQTEKRSFILLTDGMVDISKDPAVNASERKRILDVILPKLKRAGVSIHTIALSKNADHDLLKQLSTQTDGWYQAVNNAEELQKVFLKIFQQAAQRDDLPIKNNSFSVDKSVDEMTVLIFKKDTRDASLISPAGKRFNKSRYGDKARWFSTDSYDLVTIQKPETGTWKIDANVDPDNRVMVVSKLGLLIADLPNNLLAGEAINYEMKLLEDDKVISKTDFLKLVDAKLLQNKDGKESTLAMFRDSANHAFKQSFFTESFEGELKLQLQVTSPTFERERSHSINIYGSPLITEVEISKDNIAPHKVKLTVREGIVVASSLKVKLTIKRPDGEQQHISLDDLTDPVEIKPVLSGGEFRLAFKISGESVLGRKFSVSPAAIKFNSIPIASKAPEKKKVEPMTEESLAAVEIKKEVEIPKFKSENKNENEDKKTEEERPKGVDDELAETPMEEESSVNWLYVGLGANLFIGIIGFFVWRLIKKRGTKNASLLADELNDDEEEDEDEDEDEKK